MENFIFFSIVVVLCLIVLYAVSSSFRRMVNKFFEGCLGVVILIVLCAVFPPFTVLVLIWLIWYIFFGDDDDDD